jgi:hypothetical protein
MAEHWYEKQIVDIEVICSIPVRVWWAKYGTPEYWDKLEKELTSEAKEFAEFIRDHRSKDAVGMETRRKYEIHCKYCGQSYDLQDPDGLVPTCCEEAMKECEIAFIE